MEEDVKTLADYLAIAKRRAIFAIVPFVILLSASAAVAMLLPPIFQSKGTILIESQQVPLDLVRSTITSFADERIQIIKQRIMTSAILMGIIEKNGLYRSERKKLPQSVVVDKMRENVAIERVNADVIDPRGGRSRRATIAFTIAFDSENPRIAQAVANELVTLFLAENTRARTESATETTEFLEQQADKLRTRIDGIEERIAAYKEEYKDVLPENLSLNSEILNRAETAMFQAEREIRDLEERQSYLRAELTALKSLPVDAVTRRGEPTDPAEQLKALRTQYVSLSAVYGTSHPDVLSIQRKIDAFEEAIDPAVLRADLEDQLAAARTELTAVSRKYSAEHPDVRALRRRVDVLTKELSDLPSASAAPTVTERKNPAFVQLEVEAASLPARLDAVRRQRDTLKKRIADLEDRILRTPQVGRGLRALERDLENTTREFEKLRAKQQDAQLAENLEVERKAERFSLLEPPLLPEQPEKPDRIKILFLGFVFSVLGGLGSAVAAEGLDRSVRGPRALASILGRQPLAVVPYIKTQKDKRRRRVLWITLAVIAFAGIAVALFAVHNFYKPLDLLWAAVLRRFGIY